MIPHVANEHPPLFMPAKWLAVAEWRHVRELVEKAHAGDDSARRVLNDWCLENGHRGGATQILWDASKPTKYQQKVTLFVIGRETVSENWLGGEHDHVLPVAMREAQRQLAIHTHAPWIRVVPFGAIQSPRGAEVLLDQTYHRNGERAMRARCNVVGCLNESIGAIAKQPKHVGTAALFPGIDYEIGRAPPQSSGDGDG